MQPNKDSHGAISACFAFAREESAKDIDIICRKHD